MQRGFTLIELLVVIAIVAVLAVTVILTLNPAQLLKQARDSTRISDITVLNKALAVYQAEAKSPGMGTADTVYVSIPSASPTCAGLGLPALPSGWSYACKAAANLRKTDGTGWIPVNLGSISSGTPLAALPVDPANATSTGLYYLYTVSGNGRFALTAGIESAKFLSSAAGRDGGIDPTRFESGTNPAALATLGGLAGYWRFDEASGSTAADSSGNGRTATWAGSGTRWTAGKVGNGALFNGTSDYLTTAGSAVFSIPQGSFAYWFQAPQSQVINARFVSIGTTANLIETFVDGTKVLTQYATPAGGTLSNAQAINDGAWHHVVTTWGSEGPRIYLDGAFVASNAFNATQALPASPVVRIGSYAGGGYFYSGIIDELRIYNRVLSGEEASALYVATK